MAKPGEALRKVNWGDLSAVDPEVRAGLATGILGRGRAHAIPALTDELDLVGHGESFPDLVAAQRRVGLLRDPAEGVQSGERTHQFSPRSGSRGSMSPVS